MLDVNLIREFPNKVKESIKKRGEDEGVVDQFLKIDQQWRLLKAQIDDLKSQQKKLGSNQREEAKKIKEKIQAEDNKVSCLEKERELLHYQMSNLTQDDVPIGKDEKENVVIKEWGNKPQFDFKPKDYMEIAENLDLIDVKRAAKISGARFGFIKKEAVFLELALINFAFDILSKQSFVPIVPPVMIKSEMMGKMGYLKKTQDLPAKWENEEVYFLRDDDLILVGTSEQSIGSMHADEVFEKNDLPKRYAGFSTCFRREAGAYGKDTKGILRVHQFDKIEMFSFCQPQDSKEEHNLLLQTEEKLMQLLNIPYRVVKICSGDLGSPAAAKYDIEAWLPGQPSTNSGQGTYRETHSTSNCTDFQARRLNIRYRDLKTNKLEFVHTLNGTALAIGRTLIAIIENYQTAEGNFVVPEVLRKYFDGLSFDHKKVIKN
ncbi:MAG: serine--tRNA ligase [Candidatus Liptonbacteria bacterium]|nr:serine--tRNA ligase [Candidatus Liptonbacteria bacterium]